VFRSNTYRIRPWLSSSKVSLAFALLLVGAAWVGFAAPAAAGTREFGATHRTLVLKARFTRVAGSELRGDGQYVFVGGAPFASDAGVLINGRTGRQTPLSFPGCYSPSMVGGPWLLYSCGLGASVQLELYSISTGESQAVTVNPLLAPPYCIPAVQCVGLAAVGADWLAFTTGVCQEHCSPTYAFQNIQSGATVGDPSNRTTTVDVDSLGLSEELCSPVMVPYSANLNDPPPGWGSVTFDGPFAVVSGPGGVYLERCGTRLREFLTHTTSLTSCAEANCPPPSNSHSIVWQSASCRLSGVFLPDRQRFVIHVPAPVGATAAGAQCTQLEQAQYTIALTPRALFLSNQQGQIWTTPSPSLPTLVHGPHRWQ
jgi:hypothetical protein